MIRRKLKGLKARVLERVRALDRLDDHPERHLIRTDAARYLSTIIALKALQEKRGAGILNSEVGEC